MPNAAETTTSTVVPPAPASASPQKSSEPSWRPLLEASDSPADAGPSAAPYADARRILFDENGTDVRVTVVVGAPIPSTLSTGEVVGLGIDFYRSDTRNSDYQLFVDGGSDGWVAYLQSPGGFVQFPGSFELGGDRLVLTVPWSSLGGRAKATVSAFLDWSSSGASHGEDFVPDSGPKLPLNV